MFGKKKEQRYPLPSEIPSAIPPQQVQVKRKPIVPDYELDNSRVEEAKEIKKAVEEKAKAEGRIIVVEILENGLFRSVIISNKSLGEAGQTFDLDED
jgi:hypothetical protein